MGSTVLVSQVAMSRSSIWKNRPHHVAMSELSRAIVASRSIIEMGKFIEQNLQHTIQSITEVLRRMLKGIDIRIVGL